MTRHDGAPGYDAACRSPKTRARFRRPATLAGVSELPTLTLPESLDSVHAGLLRELHFVTVGDAGDAMALWAFRELRVVYAITNPARTEIVYVGDSEVGRDLAGRIKDHLSRREKAGYIERDSLVFAHVLITEYLVLDRFRDLTGSLPRLNKRVVRKHNDLETMAAYEGRSVEEIRREIEALPEPSGSGIVRLLNAFVPTPLKAARRPPPPRKVKRKRKAKRKRARGVTIRLLC